MSMLVKFLGTLSRVISIAKVSPCHQIGCGEALATDESSVYDPCQSLSRSNGPHGACTHPLHIQCETKVPRAISECVSCETACTLDIFAHTFA